MSALEEAEILGLQCGELERFLGARGIFRAGGVVRRERLEARGHGLPGAQWATRNEVGYAPEVVVAVWRYGESTEFGRPKDKRRFNEGYAHWRERALRVLRACLRGTPEADEFAKAVLAAVRLGGDPALFEREARAISRRRRPRRKVGRKP